MQYSASSFLFKNLLSISTCNPYNLRQGHRVCPETMRSGTAFEWLLGLAACAASIAQQAPPVVIADPPAEKQYPAALVGLTVPGHGADMDATFYLAAGAGTHGTVLLLHGLPGYEQNMDL